MNIKYQILNEVLIKWNKSSKEDSDNVFLKSEDIKKSLDRYFVYRLNKKDQIKIFNAIWPELEKYKDKVWINGKHIELDPWGYTVDWFEPGEYKVYIEDIDKIIDIFYMFYGCEQLVSAFIPNSVTSIGSFTFNGCSGLANMNISNSVIEIDVGAFFSCSDLTSVTIPNSVTSIGRYAFAYCRNLKTVYVEDINKFNQIKFRGEAADPRYYGAKLIELKK